MTIQRMLWIAPIGLVIAGIAFLARKDAHDDDVFVKIRKLAAGETECCGELEKVHYEPPPVEGAFIQLTGIRDDELVSEGFTLTQPTEVRIYAVGEGSGGDMYDYGWIVDAATRQAVWRMDYRDTEHAGGASKNRMVDNVTTLQPGRYMVYYTTDGSHSWSDWNSSAPIDPEAWGITLLVPSGVVDPSVVQAYEAAADQAFVAQLSGVGDDQRASERFTLEEETEVRIYALGEGSGGDMHDYAWIEDASTGQTAWKMTYWETAHAGGADKNRLFDGTTVLSAGRYVLHYVTDGSHSAEDWNATPPDDPLGWGVTLRRTGS